ncbi:Vibriobactin-specific 2,3-dihydroxybenzoate-AMP ligase [Vibrio nigripulchritudo MADA3029]|uniref:(2,3-dihydroxybenzoyl)adenylate synthase n=1 Tax=Vibrio nigripulchritudo TaxID=28173 RepID=UPI0003B1B89A|nr:AMP-binding protein [Vibrio nigripulchritudo]CCN45532.1 Vibriobactin-specific 2,3-dihydroxybenzoate-AMP ligase [Vibrio nigripulchritudo MADA3020]CCN55785.1 Vibriobactin-specific 2,3-dihydroxybenzoate-AMP ligase [Vibrio nigripulchritudo MADA3021]CCN57009.1 Vibriobactin-specific 2,3-dihydroxybenzoate-AMP ligase [Vibrio nigripulchritudo MADA3029]
MDTVLKDKSDHQSLLLGFVEHPESQTEKYKEAGIWRDTPLWGILSEGVERNAEKVAVSDSTGSYSYKKLLEESDKVAAGLVESGLNAGDRVVFQVSNSIHFATVFFALQRAGLVPVLALPAHGIAEISHFVKVSGASGYIGSNLDKDGKAEQIASELSQDLLDAKHTFIVGESNQFQPLPLGDISQFKPAEPNPNDPALFLVSGGTTGLPKLIPRTHNDYRYNIESCSQASELSDQEVYLAVLPAAHNFTLGCPGLLGALQSGGEVFFSANPSPDFCFDLIEKHGVTATALVPALAQLWTAAKEWEQADTSSLRLMQVGGSKLAYTDALAVQKVFPGALQQVFGMAEGLIACTRLGDDSELIATKQGKPVSHWDEVRVVDGEGKAVSVGEEGELLTRGPYTLRGYYRADEHNQRSFTDDGFYRSGDRVVVDGQGYIVVTGRIKDVVNRAGECVATDEIEEQLLAHPNVAQVAVVPVPDKHLGERIGVAVVRKGSTPTLQDLRAFLKEQGIASFKLPDEINIVSSLPKTAVGKIDKKRVPGPDGTPWVSTKI